MPKQPVAVVDGANIAYAEQSKAGKPKVSNLVAVKDELQQRGYQVIVIVDASLIHSIDDHQQLDAQLEDQVFRQVPATTDADYFILETAQEMDAIVVSNDRYEDYQDKYPWIEERRVPVMIIQGNAQLYEPRLQEANRRK